MCLKGKGPTVNMKNPLDNKESESENYDKACSDAYMLLKKFALSRQSTNNVIVVVVDIHYMCVSLISMEECFCMT